MLDILLGGIRSGRFPELGVNEEQIRNGVDITVLGTPGEVKETCKGTNPYACIKRPATHTDTQPYDYIKIIVTRGRMGNLDTAIIDIAHEVRHLSFENQTHPFPEDDADDQAYAIRRKILGY